MRGYDLSVHWGKLRVELGLGAESAFMLQSPSRSIKSGVWSHVAATFDGGEIVLFINATEQGRRRLPEGARLVTTNRPLIICKWEWKSSYPYWGQLDDVKVYSSALSERQILEEASRFLQNLSPGS